MRLKVLSNPSAGRGRTGRMMQRALTMLRARGADVDHEASRSPEHLVELAAAASRRDYDRVVICGGDGSLNLAVRQFDLTQGTLALLPLGSGDDFARVLGIPRRIEDACNVVIDGVTREVDVATANDMRYLGVAGVGFDSVVARYANEEVKFLRGSAVYLYATLRVIPRFKPLQMRMSVDGRPRHEEVMFVVVGNSRQYGGGIRIVPDAKVDDGLLNFAIIHRCTRLDLLKTLPKTYTGAHVNSSFVETGTSTVFRIESDEPLDAYADGERITRTPVTFRLEAQRLRIVVPPN
jgi:diacylglycerol kinase (ATP)